MEGIRRETISPTVVASAAGFATIRRKPVGSPTQYYPAAQQDEDDLGYNHRYVNDGSTWTGQLQSPTSGHGRHRYDLVETQDIGSEVPPLMSPVRPSEEYEHHPPSEPSPIQPAVDLKYNNTSVVYTHESPPSGWQDGVAQRMWTPIWLSKTVLIVFGLIFACMALATGLLYHFSVQNNGISAQKESNHYGWKYGPTALLVVVGALWRQVDHGNKMLMPWKELQQGPAPVDKSLLLDYVSPILSTALWKAIKNRHWAVVLSITGHLLILGTTQTIFSTGLLILESTEVTKQSQDFSLKGEFQIKDAADVDLAFKVGPAAAQLYYGIHFQGLHYPAGTSEDIIVPELQLPDNDSADLNYTLTTEGIQVELDCELLPVTNGSQVYMPWRSILGPFIVTNISTPDCDIKGVTIGVGPDHYYYHNKNATQNYQGIFETYPCNVDFNFGTQYVAANDTKTSSMISDVYADQRLVMSVADLRVSPYNASKSGPDYFYVKELKLALCKPSYNIHKFDVQSSSVLNGSAQAILSSAAKSGERLLTGLPSGAVAMGVRTTTRELYLGPGGADYALSEEVPTFFQLMSMKNGNSSVGAFLDPELLVKTGSDVFKGIATQLMRQLTLQPTNTKVAGKMTYVEDRLHVKALSTGFMCAFLGLLTLLSVGMIFVRPRNVIPHEPGSATAMATILAVSHGLRESLMHMGSLRRSQIRTRLQGLSFRSVVVPGPTPGFVVEPIAQSKEQDSFRSSKESQAVSWWWPVAGTSWFVCLAIVLPLLLIAALEIVQHFSDANSGFIGIGPSDSIVLATYIPAAVVLGVASMYSAIEFMVAVFAPFHALKRGGATAKRSVGVNLVGKLLPHAAFLSLRSRHFAVLVALLANFIGGFLTIVVSGLYSAVDVPRVQEMTIQQTDSFNFEQVDLSLSDNQAAAIDSLIEYLDLDYPKWTHKGLVYNNFEAPHVDVKNATAEAPLNVNIPAVRAKLNCTPVVEERLITKVVDKQGESFMQTLPGQNGIFTPVEGFMQIGLNTTLEFSKWCETSPNENETEASWMQYFLIPYGTVPAYVGKASIMTWANGTIMGDGGVNTNPTTGSGYGSGGLATGSNGCPTFALTFGTLGATDWVMEGDHILWTFAYNLGTLLCYQNLEQVDTNVTWDVPDFEFASSGTPKVDKSTASLLKNDAGSQRFEFAVNAWLEGLSDSVYNRTIPGPNKTSPIVNDVDQFVQALVYGKNGRPLEELLGEENEDNMAKVANDIYQVYMAQAISLNMRSNSTKDGSRLPTYTGSLTTSGNRRLKQNKGTKIALQAMLATMVACVIATALLMRVRGVLPHNPCSIAGTATLLAGGDMASRDCIPPGSEWRSYRELSRMGVFENNVYSLKWWDASDGAMPGKQRYGIDADRVVD
ncbi:hypothetical protein FZEAL_2708 [Fusarium zealandicum]|uniref:Uncharacterized protein n=1 Tax=Fusarium zealandicum TaxID=1053134 RepID=A0A8H4UQY7_9HYPO|nr:hypothetical protein FZEAL_2708 [Fusarium zealandicum]